MDTTVATLNPHGHSHAKDSRESKSCNGWAEYYQLDTTLKQSAGSLALADSSEDDNDTSLSCPSQPPTLSVVELAHVTKNTEPPSNSAPPSTRPVKSKKTLHYVPFTLSQDPTFEPKSSMTTPNEVQHTPQEESAQWAPQRLSTLQHMSVSELSTFQAHTTAHLCTVSHTLVHMLCLQDRLASEHEALSANTAQLSHALLARPRARSSAPLSSLARWVAGVRGVASYSDG